MAYKGLVLAYSGFLTDPEYTRRSENETVSGQWLFKDIVTFDKVIRGTTVATYYGDLAEYYENDEDELLPEGTLVKFGGKKEITKTKPNDKQYFGVISSNPGVTLNQKSDDKHSPVALSGRVPVRVNGKIHKFDKLTTSSIHGVAKRKTIWDVLRGKPTIGTALESKSDKSEKLITVFVLAHQ